MKRKPKSTQETANETKELIEQLQSRVKYLIAENREFLSEIAELRKENTQGMEELTEDFKKILGRVAQRYGERVYDEGKLIGWRMSVPVQREHSYKWPKTRTAVGLKEVYQEEEKTLEMLIAEVLEDVD